MGMGSTWDTEEILYPLSKESSPPTPFPEEIKESTGKARTNSMASPRAEKRVPRTH